MLRNNRDAGQASAEKVGAQPSRVTSRAHRRPHKRAEQKPPELRDEMARLRDELYEIDSQLTGSSLQMLTAQAAAMDRIWWFLLGRNIYSHAFGSAVHRARRKKPGRRQDSVPFQRLKGALAAIVRLEMESGRSRKDAAKYVANRIPRAMPQWVASAISSMKGAITSSALLQYMDLYDCGPKLLKKFEDSDNRKKFAAIFRTYDDYDRARNRRHEQRVIFLRENTPLTKRRMYGRHEKLDPEPGLSGFACVMYVVACARAGDYVPSCDELLEIIAPIIFDQDYSKLTVQPK
jgi:hypothetical protein